MPPSTTPSGEYTVPSAWKPGPAPVNPRSTTSSGCAQPAGTAPVTWNHTVPHGRPHASPTAKGRYSRPTASANGTGSPGAVHAATRAGAFARCSAGVSRSRTKRATRGRTKPESSCTAASCAENAAPATVSAHGSDRRAHHLQPVARGRRHPARDLLARDAAVGQAPLGRGRAHLVVQVHHAARQGEREVAHG